MAELAVERPDVNVAIEWKPFLLRPNMPEEGQPKAPDTPDNPRVGARLKQAGASSGINFTGKTDRTPNATRAHALVKFFEAKESQEKGNKWPLGLQDCLMNIIFRHYFTDGLYPNKENLTTALREALQKQQSDAQASLFNAQDVVKDAVAFMEDANNRNAVAAEAAAYSRGGVSGVPYFFFGGQPAFSGAQPPSTLKQSILSVADN